MLQSRARKTISFLRTNFIFLLVFFFVYCIFMIRIAVNTNDMARVYFREVGFDQEKTNIHGITGISEAEPRRHKYF